MFPVFWECSILYMPFRYVILSATIITDQRPKAPEGRAQATQPTAGQSPAAVYCAVSLTAWWSWVSEALPAALSWGSGWGPLYSFQWTEVRVWCSPAGVRMLCDMWAWSHIGPSGREERSQGPLSWAPIWKALSASFLPAHIPDFSL